MYYPIDHLSLIIFLTPTSWPFPLQGQLLAHIYPIRNLYHNFDPFSECVPKIGVSTRDRFNQVVFCQIQFRC